MNKKTIAFIGAVGLPNRYGGFESFLEHVAPVIVAEGHNVCVTCYAGAYEEHSKYYEGVERIFINLKANGPLSPIHDFIAFLKVFRRSKNIVVLGVSAGPFFVLMRLLSFINKNEIITNIDGVEWRRDKYKGWVKFVLFVFDYLAQIFSTKIVFDNIELKSYIKEKFINKSVCIAYSGDHVKKYYRNELKTKKKSALTICRIEPENNIDLLINGVLNSAFEEYIIIGNFQNSQFGKDLIFKYQSENRIIMLDPIYDGALINQYRQEAAVYLHGHSVGGTNPSLVEMLYYNCYIYCFECGFNRATAGSRAEYFNDSTSLAILLDSNILTDHIEMGYKNSEYTATKIAEKYTSILK